MTDRIAEETTLAPLGDTADGAAGQHHDSDSTGRSEGGEGSLSPPEDDEYRTDLTNIIISSESSQPSVSTTRPCYDVIHRVSTEKEETDGLCAEGEQLVEDGICPMDTNPPEKGPLAPELESSQEKVSPGEEADACNNRAAEETNMEPEGEKPLATGSLDAGSITLLETGERDTNDAEMPLNESSDSLLAAENYSQPLQLTDSQLMCSDLIDSNPALTSQCIDHNGDISLEQAPVPNADREFLDNSEEALTLNVTESLSSSRASSGTGRLDRKESSRGGAENFDEISDIENWDDLEGGEDELWKLSFQPSVGGVGGSEDRADEDEKEQGKGEESRGMREQMSPISSGDEFGEAEDKEKYFRKGEGRELEESDSKNEMIGQSILVIGGGAASHGRYQSRSRDRPFEFNEPLSPAPNEPVPKQLEAKNSNANLTRIIKMSEDATSDISDSSFKDTMDDFEDPKAKSKHVRSRHSRSHEPSSHSKDLPFSDKLFVDAKYFIMKSNNHENIRIAKEKYAWSTPLPNEKKLSQSYRQHKNIILLFSVRESGRFQGFARLASDVKRSGPSIQWHLPHGINANSLGGIFRLQWVCKDDLEFSKCQDVSNPWNDHKPVKISRDGQELPPAIGEKLCRIWFERPDTPPISLSPTKPTNSTHPDTASSPPSVPQAPSAAPTTTAAASSAAPFTAPTGHLHYPAFPYPYLQPATSTPHSVQLQNYLAQAQQQQLLVAQGVRPPASYASYPYLHQQLQSYAAMAQSMHAFSHAQQASKLAMWNAENQQQRKAMAAAMNYFKEAAAMSKTKSPKDRTPPPSSKRRRMTSDSSSKKSHHHDLRHSLRADKESHSYHRSNSSRSAKSRHSSSSKHRRYSGSRKYSGSKLRKERRSHTNRSHTHSSSSLPQDRGCASDNRKESASSQESIEISPLKDPTEEFGVNEEILLHGSYDDYLKEMELKGVHATAGLAKQKSRENTSS